MSPVGLFVQVPVDELNVWPTWAVPETAGSTVFAGGGFGLDETTAVWFETAGVPGPPAFVAVTATRIVEPTSARTSR